MTLRALTLFRQLRTAEADAATARNRRAEACRALAQATEDVARHEADVLRLVDAVETELQEIAPSRGGLRLAEPPA